MCGVPHVRWGNLGIILLFIHLDELAAQLQWILGHVQTKKIPKTAKNIKSDRQSRLK